MCFEEAHTKGENEWLSDLGQAYKTQDTSPLPLPSLINYFLAKILNIEPFIFGGDFAVAQSVDDLITSNMLHSF